MSGRGHGADGDGPRAPGAGRGPPPGRRWFRSRHDRRIAGVAGGLAAFLDASPATLRWLFALSLVPTIGISGVGYLLLWLLLPAEPR